MFERFTDRARRVVVLAQEHARALDHHHIGTEHILLGLVSEGEGVAAQLLGRHQIDLATARERVEELVGRGQTRPLGHLPFTPRAKKLIEDSLREAIGLDHERIGTEHLLLALLRQGDSVAHKITVQRGLEYDGARAAVVEIVGSGRSERTTESRWFGFASSRASLGVKAEQQVGEPLCPVCQAKLIETASYRILEVAEYGGEGHRRVLFLFCLRCGTAIDNEIQPEQGQGTSDSG